MRSYDALRHARDIVGRALEKSSAGSQIYHVVIKTQRWGVMAAVLAWRTTHLWTPGTHRQL